MKIRKIKKFIFDPTYRFEYLRSRGCYKKMDDVEYLKRIYKNRTGKELNIAAPVTFNEKIQWLKLYDKRPVYTQMADKYEAKILFARLLGDEFIIPTYGIFNSFDEIDFSKLPNQFVLKTTHDSGGIVICRDKSVFDVSKARKKMERWRKRDFYYVGREWPYKDIKHRIIAEKYMEQPGERGLIDYKFFCFNNTPEFLYVSRGLEHHPTAEISFYDMTGNEMYFYRKDYRQYHNAVLPSNFEEMRAVAAKLAKYIDRPFIRVDLYSIENQIYFSEITFSPCGGMIPFEPESADEELGKMIKLPYEN